MAYPDTTNYMAGFPSYADIVPDQLGSGTFNMDSAFNFKQGEQPSMMSAFSNWLKSTGAIGSTDAKGIKTDGWGGLALGAAQGLGSAYMGMKQYGIAKDTLENNKRQFDLNYNAQKTTTNAQLEDRQRARVASNASAYQSVGDYMKQNGIQ
jgi:hypothetical protein